LLVEINYFNQDSNNIESCVLFGLELDDKTTEHLKEILLKKIKEMFIPLKNCL
jgi:hypothetical protein